MAAGLLPNEGIAAQLEYVLRATISGVLPWQLVLWVNDLVPDADTVLADLVEATWSGYSRKTLDRPTWTSPTVSDGCAASTWGTDPITFYVGAGSPQTNYGAAYVDASSGLLRWIQRFDDEDIRPVVPGGKFLILPQYTLTSAECQASMREARRRARRVRPR